MASPSRVEIETQWKNAVDVIETARAFLDGTLLTDWDTLEQSVEGDFTPRGITTWAAANRANASVMIDAFAARTMLEPLIYEYGKFISSDFRNAGAIWGDVYRYMHDNSLSVNSRDIVFASMAAGGSNVGDGTLRRLNVDENGYSMEACHIELKTARCVQDGNTGTNRHAENFDLYGINAPKDGIARLSAGSGRRLVGMRAKHAGGGPGGSRLLNSSFTTYNASGTVTTKFRGWTITNAVGNVTEDTTNFYRGHPGDGDVTRALQFSANEKLVQKIKTAGIRLNPNLPYFLRVMFNRAVGSGTGTLTIRCGTNTASVVLAAQTGWNELALTIDANLWPINFYEDDLDIEIEISGMTGTVLIDDVWFGPWDFFDGGFWLLFGGATPFAIEDVFTGTDTGGNPGTTGKLQYYNWLSGFGYLPSATAAGETWTDP
jgi:hypothetical protein